MDLTPVLWFRNAGFGRFVICVIKTKVGEKKKTIIFINSKQLANMKI